MGAPVSTIDLKAFRVSLDKATPPGGLSVELRALWHAAKGDWDAAHKLVQDAKSSDAAWVHAYLHRVEGDLSNAGYWYHRAGRPKQNGALDVEWSAIATALLH